METLKNANVSPGTTEADAVDLLRACSPYEPPAGRKQRVRQAMTSRERSPRPRGLWLRPAVVTVLVLAVVTTASSSMGRTWMGKIYRQLTGAPAETDSAAPAPRHRAARPAPAPAAEQPTPAPAETLEEPPATAPAAVAPATAPVSPVTRPDPAAAVARHARPARVASISAERAHSAEDAGLVVAAMQALRSSADPVKAGALLDEYLRRHPHGILAEEALTLSIEAALARGDARARPLAQLYLSRYPNGSFRPTAERAARGP